tara:strand:+ start:413 stop:619 length:207 start_codon:yes stop_codon:yes gene_type:complete
MMHLYEIKSSANAWLDILIRTTAKRNLILVQQYPNGKYDSKYFQWTAPFIKSNGLNMKTKGAFLRRGL